MNVRHAKRTGLIMNGINTAPHADRGTLAIGRMRIKKSHPQLQWDMIIMTCRLRLTRFLRLAPKEVIDEIVEMYKTGEHTQAGIARILSKKYNVRVISEHVRDIVLFKQLPVRGRREWNEIAARERMRKKLTADPWLRGEK